LQLLKRLNVFSGIVFCAVVFLTAWVPPALGEQAPAVSSKAAVSELDLYYQWLDMGEAAVPQVKKALESPNWRMRTHALLAVGKLGRREMIPRIIDILETDDHPAVKNCAVTALGDLTAAAAVPGLIALLKETPSPRKPIPDKRVIIQSLGKIGDARAAAPLYAMLKTAPEAMRGDIAAALVMIGDQTVSEWILAEKKPGAAYPFLQAAMILGELPVEKADDFVMPLLGDHRPQVQNAAAIALGKMRSEKSVPALIKQFNMADGQLRDNIAAALIAIDAPAAIRPLCDLLGHADSETAMTAARILSAMTVAGIDKKVFEMFQADAAVNAPAAYILGRKDYDGALPVLRDRLARETGPGQEQMAEALGLLNDAASVPLLLNVAARKSANGSAGAIWALGRMKVETAVPVLLDLLRKKDRRLMFPLIAALGDIGDPAAVKPLMNLYYGSNLQYQHQIALALARIGGPDVAAFIKDNMESGNDKRRRMAGFMLLKSTDAGLVPYAVSLLDDPDESIRKYAMGGLKNITGLDYESVAEWKAWADAALKQ